ncbi:MAG: Flp pilus assembly protein CpaB [Gemmatimonadetes bacterium]|nr:Flp pilus assembly protein CpaB [Gemmatimonadota bacterium]
MRNRVGVILTLALVSGLLAAYLAFRFLRQPAETGPVEVVETQGRDVLVAARDLVAGHLIQQGDVRTVTWPEGELPNGVARSMDEVVGRGLLGPILQGETITARKIALPQSGNGLQLSIPHGMRAVTVRVNEVIGVGGWLHEGMRVDVLVTLDQGAQIDDPTTDIIVQDVEIARIGQTQEMNDQNESIMVTNATLFVDPDGAQRVTLAETKGQIRLVLRNPLDRDTVDIASIRARELITGRRVVRAPGPRRPVRAAPTNNTVEIIRGTETTEESTTNGRSGGNE